jgi:SAM-dependent methyltransferase
VAVSFRGFLRAVRALLVLPDRLSEEFRNVDKAVRAVDRTMQRQATRHDAESETMRGELTALRREVHERLLQYHLQLGRLSALVDGSGDYRLGNRVPLSVAATEPQAAPGVTTQPSDGAADWLELAACPACLTADRTIVCEWNKLALLETAPDDRSRRYDYAVCHGCGILYATQRPIGVRYRYLTDHFEDVIDKDASNPLLNPRPLSDDDRERYRRLLAGGAFVSDHIPGPSLGTLFSDRMDNAGHVDLLGALLQPHGARVLEIRPRAGTILEGLRRQYGADVQAMPIWESQQFIMQELYGIPTSALIDFDEFDVPFDGEFDLVVCNHMFNHAVRLDRLLAAVRNALRSGGHLYLYNEIDDSEFLDGGQSMIATMNPLHLQASDRFSLVRAVGAAGFEPVFVKGRHRRNVCLMRKAAQPVWTPITDEALEKRIAAYRRARDRAVLRVPDAVRHRFTETWESTVQRAVATGVAAFDDEGALRLTKDGR